VVLKVVAIVRLVRFEVFIVVSRFIKGMVFWDVTLIVWCGVGDVSEVPATSIFKAEDGRQ
jgi:hypothetical protein